MVYLIHFEVKFKHCQHYLGFVKKDIDARIKLHKSGNGSRLLRAVNLAGINWEVVRIWKDEDGNFERSLKKQRNGPRFCPICNKNAMNRGKTK